MDEKEAEVRPLMGTIFLVFIDPCIKYNFTLILSTAISTETSFKSIPYLPKVYINFHIPPLIMGP